MQYIPEIPKNYGGRFVLSFKRNAVAIESSTKFPFQPVYDLKTVKLP